ncbi:hypothetical protein LAV72_02020 [Lysinibacillus xylanilyticus]|uniref:hypothetical protein n=1 Tax=Lysinibacillus xylanilyticus TaxID=582475 RepID=UPI002B246060|nr:hypothetical protein [Lysinibacillus xylanilyticus]MEB2298405.1 hypothetical protein [Lysinibacillus xylanilyticus]
MNEASIISGLLFFVTLISMIMVIFMKESSSENPNSTISSAPFWVNIIWVVVTYLPFKIRKIIYSFVLILLTILFGYLFVSTL